MERNSNELTFLYNEQDLIIIDSENVIKMLDF